MAEPQKSQAEINREIHTALFGNPETGEVGIVSMTKEMYQAWSALLWIGRIATWAAVILAGIGAVWSGFGSWIKHLLTNK